MSSLGEHDAVGRVASPSAASPKLTNTEFFKYMQYLSNHSPDAPEWLQKLEEVKEHARLKGKPRRHGGLASKTLDKIATFEARAASFEAAPAAPVPAVQPVRPAPAPRPRTKTERNLYAKLKALGLHTKDSSKKFKDKMHAKKIHKSVADLKRKTKYHWPRFVEAAKGELQKDGDLTFESMWDIYDPHVQ